MLSIKIGFVGLIARVCGHAVLLGRERMYDAHFKTCFGECSFGNKMVIPGSFDNHDHVFDVVLLLDLTNLRHSHLEECRLMSQRLWRDKQLAKVIGHHPFGPLFGGINAHDGKSITADLGDARPDNAIGLLQVLPDTRPRLRSRPIFRTLGCVAREARLAGLD